MKGLSTGFLIACLAFCGPTRAESTAGGQTDFTFHMVKPPAPGQTRLITVQIDPAEQAKRLAPPPPIPVSLSKPLPPAAAGVTPTPDATPSGARYAWFWDAVSPGLARPEGRFSRALAALSLGPNGEVVSAPRLRRLQRLSATYGKTLLQATVGKQVSPAFALAVIAVESGGNPKAVSRTGAQGLMQLMPGTAKRFNVKDAFDPTQNIQGGVDYLDWLMGQFNGDPLMVLAAYNAGENAVLSSGGVPATAETRDYVPKVLAAWREAQGLCLTPPELVSDGCVFRTATTVAAATN